MLKKGLIVLLVGSMAICGAVALSWDRTLATASPQIPRDLPPTQTLKIDSNVSSGDFVGATYIKDWSTIDEMAQNADAVVVAKVGDQSQFNAFAVTSQLEVLLTIKGNITGKPVLTQLGKLGGRSDELLSPGKTYFLFLGKQGDGSPENTWHILSGIQGKFEQQNGKLHGVGKFVKELTIGAEDDAFSVLEQKVKKAINK